MIPVQFPTPQFRIKKKEGRDYIFDSLRKSWLLLTEEEWVRQNFINYLITALKIPSALIAIEKEIFLNSLKKRFDILVYNAQHQPWMMVECKAPQISLSEEVLQQVLRYHISVPVEYIVITNGDATIGWKKENTELKLLHKLPMMKDEFHTGN